MKSNAIVRIVIYSLVILLLIGLLLAGMGIGSLSFRIGSGSGEVVTGKTASVSAEQVTDLKIEWASGSITIQTGETDEITFTESGSFSEEHAMAYALKDGTLKLQYAKASVQIGFISIPSKDLVITVPKDWVCQELELDGASLDMDINGLTIEQLEINGASNTVTVHGSVKELDCDGASCEITLNSTNSPSKIDIDGASCQLNLTLPEDCGFRVELEGLSCSFHSDFAANHSNGRYTYGNEHCYITADGLSCEVNIYKAQ